MGRTKELRPVVRQDNEHSTGENAPILHDDNQGYGSINDPNDSLEASADSYTETEPADIIPISKKTRLIKTICMLGIYIGMGLWAGVVTTTNVDMVNLYSCTYDDLNKACSMKALGVIGGSFLGAAISDRFRRQADLFLANVCFIGGVTIALVPWAPNLILMGVLFIINGLSHGISNVVCSSITIAIWGKEAASPVMALHMCFNVGTSIAPILTAPFLSKVDTNNSYVHSDLTLAEVSSSGNVTSSHIRIPYGMFGIWSVIVGVIFLALFIYGSGYTSKKILKKEPFISMLNPKKCANGNVLYGLYFVTSLLFLYMFINARNRALPTFLFAIANKGLGMDKTVSALLLTTYNFSAALSRGICVVILKYAPVQAALAVQIAVGTLLQMYLMMYGLESPTSLWILSCSVVLFLSPTYPTAMAWADQYIEVTGAVVAIIDIGIGLGGFLTLIVTGILFQNRGSQSILTLAFILGCVVTITYLPMQIIGHMKGGRHKKVQFQQTISVSAQHEPIEPVDISAIFQDDTEVLIS